MAEITQSFNGGQATNYISADMTDATATGLIALMPLGVTVWENDGAVEGTAVAKPATWTSFKVSARDRNEDGSYSSNLLSVKYGKPAITTKDIVIACKGVMDTPNGTTADKVGVYQLKSVGV
jgi:hypothetical protein